MSTNCDMEAVTRNVADLQGNITDIVTGLNRDTVRSCDSVCWDVEGALLIASKRLREAFNCKTRSLRQIVLGAMRRAAKEARSSFFKAQSAIVKRSKVVIGQTSSIGRSASTGDFLSYNAS